MPRKLKPVQRAVAEQLARGMLASDIENRRNMHPGTIAKWKRTPWFLDEIERYAREYEESLIYLTRTLPYITAKSLRDSEKLIDTQHLAQMMNIVKRRKHLFDADAPPEEGGAKPAQTAKNVTGTDQNAAKPGVNGTNPVQNGSKPLDFSPEPPQL